MDFDKLRAGLQRDAALTLQSDEACLALAAEAEAAARYTAHHLDEREEIVASLCSSSSHQDVWRAFGRLWATLASSFAPQTATISSDDSRAALALALSKLERNLLAGILAHQEQSISHEPSIRSLIFGLTTFAYIEDPRYHQLQAVLAQLLSNLISPTSSEAGADHIAQTCLAHYLDGRRENDVIIRLLDSFDERTNVATLHLIANLIRGSPTRMEMTLCDTGLQWFSKILNRMDDWHTASDKRFDVAHSIFQPYLSSPLFPQLFSSLSARDDSLLPSSGGEDTPTPSQTKLLKLLDSHLSSSSPSATSPSLRPYPYAFLIPLFVSLTKHATSSLRSKQAGLEVASALEALVLVCEGLSSIGLGVQARRDAQTAGEDVSEPGAGDEDMVRAMKAPQDGIVKSLIDLLVELNTFLPRVKPGQPPLPTVMSPELSASQRSSLGSIKRALVQLLGVLTFEDKAVGDRVRECGGVEVVLGMTEVDEGNPFLREHALFVVRNLMLNNPANQAVISQMDPVGVVSETGELLPLPEKMRRQRQQREEAERLRADGVP